MTVIRSSPSAVFTFLTTFFLFSIGSLATTPPWAETGGVVSDMPHMNVTAPVIDHTVGAVGANGGADGGQAFYQIPINVVPGRNGMQPSVSASYSSSGGNGIMGVGWALNATSSISRCGSTVAHDSVRIGVTYSANTDHLCFNGSRLIALSESYGSATASYRTELDQLARITPTGSINDPSGSFTVEYADGRTAYFGTTSDSRHKATGRAETMHWALAKIGDPSGNQMHYIYESAANSGEHLLKEIQYSGTLNDSSNRKVVFTYENRKDGNNVTDYATRFSHGGKTASTFLAEIVVKGDTLVLKDVAIYGRKGGEALSGLQRDIFRGAAQLKDFARQQGFKRLEIQGKRVDKSSSARPGHDVDLGFNLQ